MSVQSFEGPQGPSTQLLSEIRYEIGLLNQLLTESLDKQVEPIALPAPNVEVLPAPVIFPDQPTPSVDWSPLLAGLAALNNPQATTEVLSEVVAGIQSLRGDFIAWLEQSRQSENAKSVFGIGASSVTVQNAVPVINDQSGPLKVTVSSISPTAATDVTDRSGRLLGHVNVDNIPNLQEDANSNLKVADDFLGVQAINQTLAPATSTPITFSQPVRMVKIKNFDTTNRLLVKSSAISGGSDASADYVGVAPVANVPTTDYFPFRTNQIYVYSPGASFISITGYF